MRFRIWEIIVLVSLIIAAIISSSLNHIWMGMVYITAAFIVAALTIFVNNRISYIIFMKKEYDEGLELYFVELYNNNLITREQLNHKDVRIIEGYYKPFKKLRLTNILIITGTILFIITLITYIFNLW